MSLSEINDDYGWKSQNFSILCVFNAPTKETKNYSHALSGGEKSLTIRLDTISKRDGQTDRQTDLLTQYRALHT